MLVNGGNHKERFKRDLINWLDEQASHYRRAAKIASRKTTTKDNNLRAEIYEHLKTLLEQGRFPFDKEGPT